MVQAVLAQSWPGELELIVVDNASVDETEAVMESMVETATRCVRYLRSSQDLGAAGGRNAGLEIARGSFVAFTDSDCVPSPEWLLSALARFDSDRVGIVQGRTEAPSGGLPLFSHYIVTTHLDGSFSTSNVLYRRAALDGLRFDGSCTYWEDVDLGWRVLARGWEARFCPEALVHHDVIPLSPWRWLTWPRRFGNWPAKAARYPGFRRHLFLGIWVDPLHMWFDLALLGAIGAFWHPWMLILGLPYVVAFLRSRGLRGRFPPAKALAHIGWDCVAFGSLVLGSVRYRALVL